MFHPAPRLPVASAIWPQELEPHVCHDKNASCRIFSGPAEMKCGIEWDEWMLVRALVRPNDTVLELGARFGTTSCALAAATRNSGKVVAVEPDASVIHHLLQNQRRCAFAALHGAVGEKPLAFLRSPIPDGYSSTTSTAWVRGRSVRVPMMTVSDLEARISAKFDVALIDAKRKICWSQKFQNRSNSESL